MQPAVQEARQLTMAPAGEVQQRCLVGMNLEVVPLRAQAHSYFDGAEPESNTYHSRLHSE